MTRRQTIQVVLEVDLLEHEQIVPEPLHPLVDQRPAPAERLANEEHAQALWDALRADPVRYAEFVRMIIVETLDTYESRRRLVPLAQIPDPTLAGYQLLRELVPHLPAATQAHFQRALQERRFTNSTHSVFNAVEVTPLHIRVEYPGTPASPDLVSNPQ